METLTNFFALLSYITVILGIPLGLYQFIKASRKEQKDREESVYHVLDERYLEFQRLCLQYPYLDVFDIPDNVPVALTEQQKKEELILFSWLLSLLERAYLLQSKRDPLSLQKQWGGWKDYIDSYCQRKNFQAAWKVIGEMWDPRFELFINEMIKKYDHT